LPSFKGKPRPLETSTRTLPFVVILFSSLKSNLVLEILTLKLSLKTVGKLGTWENWEKVRLIAALSKPI